MRDNGIESDEVDLGQPGEDGLDLFNLLLAVVEA
jgi:hypothetical protein